MRLPRMRGRLTLLNTLQDGATGNGTIGADVIGFVLYHLPEHRSADLHRRRKILGLDAPRTVVSCTPLDGENRCFRDPLQYFSRLLADVLHPRMTWDVIAHLAERRIE